MRILAFADIHGEHKVYRRLLRQVEKLIPDLIVLAGDLFGCPDGHATIENYLLAAVVFIFLCAHL